MKKVKSKVKSMEKIKKGVRVKRVKNFRNDNYFDGKKDFLVKDIIIADVTNNHVYVKDPANKWHHVENLEIVSTEVVIDNYEIF